MRILTSSLIAILVAVTVVGCSSGNSDNSKDQELFKNAKGAKLTPPTAEQMKQQPGGGKSFIGEPSAPMSGGKPPASVPGPPGG